MLRKLDFDIHTLQAKDASTLRPANPGKKCCPVRYPFGYIGRDQFHFQLK